MRKILALAVLAMTLDAAGCAGPEPRPAGPLPAQQTPLGRRLAEMARYSTIVVAHRGASARFPENTLPSFRAAVEAGAEMVELDFRQTSDGVLVCMHDQTIDRTTDGTQQFGRDAIRVASRTAAELATLDAGAWKGPEHAGTKIPTLAEALDVIQSGAITMIEHKEGDARRLVELLRQKGLVDDVLVQSFDWTWLAEVARLEPRLTLGAIGSRRLTPDRLAEIDALGVTMVHWNADDLTLADLADLHARGYVVCVYTVDSDIGLIGCLESGVDAVTTDVPGRLRELIDLPR